MGPVAGERGVAKMERPVIRSPRGLRLDSARGWPLRVQQRLRRGELVTTLLTSTPGGQEISTGYRGTLTASGLATLLRVMARRIEKAAVGSGELI